MVDREDADLNRSPIHLLHGAVQTAAAIFMQHAAKLDLTPRQFAVLVIVDENGGLNQTQIVERTGIDRSTLSDVVRRLIHRGLLRRRRSNDDARAYTVWLSDKGRRVLSEVEPAVAQADAAIQAVLSEAQRVELLQSLRAIIATSGTETAARPKKRRT